MYWNLLLPRIAMGRAVSPPVRRYLIINLSSRHHAPTVPLQCPLAALFHCTASCMISPTIPFHPSSMIYRKHHAAPSQCTYPAFPFPFSAPQSWQLALESFVATAAFPPLWQSTPRLVSRSAPSALDSLASPVSTPFRFYPFLCKANRGEGHRSQLPLPSFSASLIALLLDVIQPLVCHVFRLYSRLHPTVSENPSTASIQSESSQIHTHYTRLIFSVRGMDDSRNIEVGSLRILMHCRSLSGGIGSFHSANTTKRINH